MARVSVVVAVSLVVVSLSGAGASAGGSWFRQLSTVEPGDPVTLVGFTGGGTHTGSRDDTYIGFLDLSPQDADGNAPPDVERIDVGQITLTNTGALGWQRWRMHVTFELPEQLAPGKYWFHYGVDGDLSVGFGDLIGGVVTVGDASGYLVNEPDVHNAADPLVADLVAPSELALTGGDPLLLAVGALVLAVAGAMMLGVNRTRGA